MAEREKSPEELFYEAVEISDSTERKKFLDQICEDDRNLRTDVESLLDAYAESGDFLDIPVVAPESALPPSEGPGSVIGRYILLEKIGEGGMAVVYKAEQQQPIRRIVALKLIKLGMDTQQVITRFEAERQTLAMMDHPNIAKVLDAGATPTGRPYFVMEWVEGASITDFCDENRLNTNERLKLFINVCQGVHHAHQKGIIHRDIKPSNVMVTFQDDKPVPKVIDFGIAKATNQHLVERTFFTSYAQIIGTPEYMSPEQAGSNHQDIDTRSDIYSLGVLLYELLTGTLPFDREKLREGAFDEILKTIREEDPQRPSTRLSNLGEEAEKVALNRNTELGALTKHLQKELEWIPLKALRKEPDRRYKTVSELANDVQNYLDGNPLIAGPESATYRFKKTMKRHQTLMASVSAVLVTLVLGIVVSIMLAIGQARAKEEAQTQVRVTRAVLDFLNQDLFSSIDPARARGREVTVRETLDRASEKIEGQFKEEPLVEALIRMTLGNIYLKLGNYKEAELSFKKALEIRKRILGEDDPDTLASMNNLGNLYFLRGQYDKAKLLYLKVLNIRKCVLGEEDPKTLMSMSNLGNLYTKQGQYDQAERFYLKTLEIRKRVLGKEHTDTLDSMNNLAILYRMQGRYDEAERLYLNSLEVRKRVSGEEHPDTLKLMNNLALLYRVQGRYDEAEPLSLKAFENSKHVFGEEHPTTLNVMNDLGNLYCMQKRYDEAEELYVKCSELTKRMRGENHPDILGLMNNLGNLYSLQGRYDEAEPFYLKALELKEDLLGEAHPDTLRSMHNLGDLYIKQTRYDKAESLLSKALELRKRVLESDHPDTLNSMNTLALVYQLNNQYEDAEPLFLKAFEGQCHVLDERHPNTLITMKNIIQLYTVWGKSQLAEQWRAKLPPEERQAK